MMKTRTKWHESSTPLHTAAEVIRQYGPLIALALLGFALGWI